jgi:hypothetical protein
MEVKKFKNQNFKDYKGTKHSLIRETTCMGEAARSKPATLPPMTRPSAHAKETLSPPVCGRFPPLASCGKNDPIKERIS